MDWKTTLPILVTAGVTILGWLVAHQFNAWRDRENKRRDQRIQYLVEAFRRLGIANHHPRLIESESASARFAREISFPILVSCTIEFLTKLSQCSPSELS
ncbi:MAG: hypothetical protein ACRD82_03415 [Blastocatellia bacterium]